MGDGKGDRGGKGTWGPLQLSRRGCACVRGQCIHGTSEPAHTCNQLECPLNVSDALRPLGCRGISYCMSWTGHAESEKERKTVIRNRNNWLRCRGGTARRHIICEICLTLGAKVSEKELKTSEKGFMGLGKFRKLCGIARSLCDISVTCFDSC